MAKPDYFQVAVLKYFIRGWIAKNKALLLSEAQTLTGFMYLLMKQRNSGTKWTKDERNQLKGHMRHLSCYIPVLIVFALPGGALLFPLLAELLDRRRLARRRVVSLASAMRPSSVPVPVGKAGLYKS